MTSLSLLDACSSWVRCCSIMSAASSICNPVDASPSARMVSRSLSLDSRTRVSLSRAWFFFSSASRDLKATKWSVIISPVEASWACAVECARLGSSRRATCRVSSRTW